MTLGLDFMTLVGTNLVSGTWMEVLEIVREMDIADKEILEAAGAGSDCIDMQLSAWYVKIFGKRPVDGVVVNEFVNGRLEQNPLRKVKS